MTFTVLFVIRQWLVFQPLIYDTYSALAAYCHIMDSDSMVTFIIITVWNAVALLRDDPANNNEYVFLSNMGHKIRTDC